MNEFSVAFEDRRPIGILEGSWKTDEMLRHIISEAHRPNEKVIFDSDPKALVERLIELVIKQKEALPLVYNNHDSRSATGKDVEVIF
jgi:hypothetical protein